MTEVRDHTVGQYIEALGSAAAVPGGGSAAAVAGAMGAALVSMVTKLSAKKAKTEGDRVALKSLLPELEALVERLLELSQEDIEAYQVVIDARRSGKDGATLDRAYERAAEVPLQTASAAARGVEIAAQVSKRASEMTASDLATGVKLLQAGLDGALANVAVNLPELSGEAALRIERAYLALRAKDPP